MSRLPAVLLVLAACGGGERPVPTGDPVPRATVTPDTLVLTLAGGAEVWLGPGQPDTAADGTPCFARLVQIRHPADTVHVPLLYTIGAPEVLNDTTLRAALYRDCVPTGYYRIDIRAGQPVREP